MTTTPKFAPATGAVRSGTVQIAYRNIAIAPDTVRVKVGSKLVWTNYDEVEHNVTSEGGPQHFDSGNFGEGKTFSIVANKPGVIHYECTNHPATMNGSIEVIG
ncbi:MAG TPA: plastocyanin/azurin family copper-binding protein [Solirubrobacteraceae bacterium]|nr:plastocyanin/azurin family copper-binding protein [Solirubrobacteraceae bacterium]